MSAERKRAKSKDEPVSDIVATGAEPAEGRAFSIVGIGASAGGLEAFAHLLRSLPPATGMAFILVPHLDPRHESMLTDILSRETPMQVAEVREGVRVVPDHVYVIPPGSNMSIFHGSLVLMPREESTRLHHPIDQFLHSLADDCGSRAIGVILSGTASDGSQGLKAIKENGGITFAQDLESAKYDGMPRSAAATGSVDFILPPDRIAKELGRISRHPYMALGEEGKKDAVISSEEEGMRRIFALLRGARGVDFTFYKQPTVKRRLERRMVLQRLDNLGDYLRLLQENPAELEALYADLLINVTSFFRNPEQFTALRELIFPRVAEGKSTLNPVRIWVPGCSTGEEAYSIAIAWQEFLESQGMGAEGVPAQIFATDVSETCIVYARQGVYPEGISADVSPERLKRFFKATEQGYEVKKSVRDMCVFAQHNVVSSPPFSRIDILSCRNLLIYMGSVFQEKIIPAFHYALKPDGYLMLGTAESIGKFADRFRLEDGKNKIYSKKSTAGWPLFDAADDKRVRHQQAAEVLLPELAEFRPNPVREAEHILLNRFAPPGVIVNDDLDVIHFSGQTGIFLEHSPGQASLNLLEMARGGLQFELRSLLEEAGKQDTPVRKEILWLRSEGSAIKTGLEIIPIGLSSARARNYIILFEEIGEEPPAAPVGEEPPAAPGAAMAVTAGEWRELELARKELAYTREFLRSITSEHEATIEELRSANEEIISANEEMQSTNEELETAKEELQSTNEELITLNEELERRNLELNLVNDDMGNILTGMNIPMVILRSDLAIRRFTSAAQRVLHIQSSDIGRPIDDIKVRIGLPDLQEQILRVMKTLVTVELEAQDEEGHYYTLSIRPYRTADNRIDGVVLTFTDTTVLRQEMKDLKDLYLPMFNTLREPLLALDGELRVMAASPVFYQTFEVEPRETEGRLIYELGDGQWDIPGLRELLEKVLPESALVYDFRVEHDFPGIGRRVMILNAQRVQREEGATPLILLAIEDTTPG
jgi:two-component system CheB/CheR fusion protein